MEHEASLEAGRYVCVVRLPKVHRVPTPLAGTWRSHVVGTVENHTVCLELKLIKKPFSV